MLSTNLSCTWRTPEPASGYRTGISLHSHTKHSKEKLQFIPAFTEKWPFLQRILERQYRRSVVPVDLSRAYWTSPLTPRQAFDIERNQIENGLGLASLVSLTDHDSINAPSLLRMATETAEVPLSLEWSVPVRGTIFHLGIHNLPADQAQDITVQLHKYTERRSDATVTELLAMLHALPEVLIVFNHPLWDLCGLGSQRHAQCVNQFVEANHAFLHAFEYNGMRKWEENRKVRPLAERWQLPIVSGGDRHAYEPSASVNLSNAQSFSEFVREIRVDQQSHVLFMPQYTDPMPVRIAHSVLDIIRYYPENPEGSRRWDERVFHPDKAGTGFEPISTYWKAPPLFVERLFAVFRLADSAAVKWAAKRVYTDSMDIQMVPEGPSEAIP